MGQCSFDFMSEPDARKDGGVLSPMEWVKRRLGIKATPATLHEHPGERQPTTADLADIVGIPEWSVKVPLGGWKNSGVSGPFLSAGTGGPGMQAVTFNYPEAPANPAESHLSDVLEDDNEIPPELFLTLPEQVRILSRLAYWEKWGVLRTAIGDTDWSPEERPEDRRKVLKSVEPGSSRSLTLDEIKARLVAANEPQEGEV